MNAALIIGGAAAVGLGVAVYGALEPNSSIYGPVLSHGPREKPYLYLTFDDGPNITATEKILKILDKYHVPATFFMVGRNVSLWPSLAREVATAGYEIGNHSYQHKKLPLRTSKFILQEILTTQELISKITGVRPKFFRAPHGYKNYFVGKIINQLGYILVGWSFGVWDTALPGPEAIRERVRKKLRPGAIILLHDGDGLNPAGDRRQTAIALEGIIKDAQDSGYSFKSLSEIIKT
jgi:peptidoglycan/xylan/chitin deacetylase (PgdA/CDA1 family)